MVTGWNILLWLAVTLAFVTAENESRKGVVKLANGVEHPGVQLQEGETTVYYGIKYGTAGRFEHAQPNTNFSYLNNPDRLQAGHVCPQSPSIFAPGLPQRNLSMSEDCLYLDVYVPPSRKGKATPRPVLFWIYGGGFEMGDKDLYNSTILAKAVDAIVVTVNYRVSAFGFLSTGDEVAPGNWTLGDLKLALNWTIDNIAAFGGDPAKVTIFDESAGAVLTSALLLDDDVRYKVKAGIAFSGNSLCGWAMNINPAAGTFAIAGHLGCPNTTSAEAVACLRTLSYEVLLNGTTVLEKQLRPEDTILDIYYTPVVDGFHLQKLPEDILRDWATASDSYQERKVAMFITGCLREDFSLFTLC
ncbi:hypothetical protein RvY_16166 [Ramazzottius varieornatus]|uniref:Carboxylesterase type B domain-containing protein n=1 Tax=Ramazzottius varieornatus TaxID=947166 RepID=A0A1D1VXI0_RAMVA|nr:hypothetical protein RvY_16166 [Ramazzottius varieornatus]